MAWASVVAPTVVAESGKGRTGFVVLSDPIGRPDHAMKASGYTVCGVCSALRSGRYKLVEGMCGRDDWRVRGRTLYSAHR